MQYNYKYTKTDNYIVIKCCNSEVLCLATSLLYSLVLDQTFEK